MEVVIGGRTLTFSPLSLREIRALEETWKAIRDDKVSGIPALLAFTPHIHASVKKVHQDLTLDQLEELMSVSDLQPAQRAILIVSGLKVAETGEAQPAAE